MMTAEEMVTAANNECLELNHKRWDAARKHGEDSIEYQVARARWDGAERVLVDIQRLVR